MKVQTLQYHQLEQLAQLYEQLIGQSQNLQQMQEYFAQINEDSDYQILVAVNEKEQLLGTLMCVKCKSFTENCRPFLVIENVIVAQNARGMGVGTQLLVAADVFAAESNCSYAILVSSGDRKEAHAFYEMHGYTEDVRGFRKYYNL